MYKFAYIYKTIMNTRHIISELRKLPLKNKLKVKHELELLISKETEPETCNDFLIDYVGEKKKKLKSSSMEEIDVIL